MAENQTIEVIKAIGAIITPIACGWMIMQQSKQGKKQAEIHSQINGMQEKLVSAEKSASKAEGEIKGAAENQALTDAKEQSKK